MAERFLSVLLIAAPLWALLLLFVILYAMNTLGSILLKSSSDGKVLITEDGPELGEPMPDWFSVPAAASVSAKDLMIQPYVMLFLTSDCHSCLSVLKQIDRFHLYHTPLKFILVIDDTSVVPKEAGKKFDYVIEDKDQAVARFLQIEKFAFGVFVDESHSVRMKGVISNRSHLEGLIRRQGHYLGNLQWQTTSDVPS